MRIVTPPDRAARALELLCEAPSVANVIHFENAARRPAGDVILADVAREDTSVILSDLRELGIDHDGSIALEAVDTSISSFADEAERAAKGSPADAVIWEQVESRTQEGAELSGSFLAFMVLATLIASVALLLDSPILLVGAMVVGPEFGPIAGFCVAAVQRRRRLAAHSFVALALGFPLGMLITYLVTLAFKSTEIVPDGFDLNAGLAESISHPDFFAFFVAFCAGIAGVLSLSTAKSGALIGVLISVATIPAAAGVAVDAAYEDWSAAGGSLSQLAINLVMILAAGTLTLFIQRLIYRRRRRRHLADGGRVTSSRGRTTPPPSSESSRSLRP